MPKMKTHKGLAKRIKVMRSGKLRRQRAGRRHLLSGKSRKRKRQLKRAAFVSAGYEKRLRKLMGGR